ncbi:MAG: tRNA pseudouridine(54/55) synthase Pus10 [Candidatus Bathyarchaeota archaeon]|nr:tRNA pseudouridine(54/55) synthase Pus10 [Candidatus Bathyarchaeota archaeon]
MAILENALEMLSKYPLCNHCLGRQFALLGYNLENKERGKAIKLVLVLQSSKIYSEKKSLGLKHLKVLVENGFSQESKQVLQHLEKNSLDENPLKVCFLCDDKFQILEALIKKILESLSNYEFASFLVGIELPVEFEERNDEFKALFNVIYGESIRHEFARLIGKRIAELTNKTPEYKKPDIAIIINPFTIKVRLQVNPLFIAGRYNKLVRTIPQSKWFCSKCRGKGCKKCNGTGKLYEESVEELISEPLLKLSDGEKTSFHASGREDIDARMLGNGRPFVVEISKPKKRTINLDFLLKKINIGTERKVEVSNLQFADKDFVRRLKKGESAQKEYRVLIEFENELSEDSLFLLQDKLIKTLIKQQTPIRVLHRRADLTRERYIYNIKVKRVSPRRAEMEILCQGGLYIKELVSGDDGRTTPSVSSLLENQAKTLELDVLNVILNDKK